METGISREAKREIKGVEAALCAAGAAFPFAKAARPADRATSTPRKLSDNQSLRVAIWREQAQVEARGFVVGELPPSFGHCEHGRMPLARYRPGNRRSQDSISRGTADMPAGAVDFDFSAGTAATFASDVRFHCRL